MRQQLYTSLAQAFEQARIEEVRDNPVITMIERPTLPLKPNGRGLLRKGPLALMAGFLLGLSIAFGREVVRQGRAGNADELTRLQRLVRETARGVLPWRRRSSEDGGVSA